MIHPVFRLAASQPMWLVNHLGAYAGLMSEDLFISAAELRRRLAWQLAAVLSLLVAAVLAGVAVMLWASLPRDGMPAPGLLAAAPLLPALLGLWAGWRAKSRTHTDPLARLRLQLAKDSALLVQPNES